jgi:hypothetical protein
MVPSSVTSAAMSAHRMRKRSFDYKLDECILKFRYKTRPRVIQVCRDHRIAKQRIEKCPGNHKLKRNFVEALFGKGQITVNCSGVIFICGQGPRQCLNALSEKDFSERRIGKNDPCPVHDIGCTGASGVGLSYGSACSEGSPSAHLGSGFFACAGHGMACSSDLQAHSS